jgi:hypothetical protein
MSSKSKVATTVVCFITLIAILMLSYGTHSEAQVGKKFQYTCFPGREFNQDQLIQKFNELGAQGWEFVGTGSFGGDQPVNCFKK